MKTYVYYSYGPEYNGASACRGIKSFENILEAKKWIAANPYLKIIGPLQEV